VLPSVAGGVVSGALGLAGGGRFGSVGGTAGSVGVGDGGTTLSVGGAVSTGSGALGGGVSSGLGPHAVIKPALSSARPRPSVKVRVGFFIGSSMQHGSLGMDVQ
jgi:hypothetical protein